jgi:phosphoglucosamine mutase
MADAVLKYFGTDGIRGRIGKKPMTPDFIMKLGWAVGSILESSPTGKKVLIGKDTRVSGYLFESALQTGLSAAGADVLLTGPMPTSSIAYLTRTLHAQIGIVISASHNSNLDNGIKFFSSDGFKLPHLVEEEIEKQLEKSLEIFDTEALGKAFRVNDAPGRYIEFCKSAVSHHCHFDQLKVVVDCANGATYHIAPKVFTELGAKVITMNTTPNGYNINLNAGSQHPSFIQKRVIEEKADLGIAFDGDGDRLIMVDHRGEIVEGDEIIYMIAKHLLNTRQLSGGVVGTLMSNSGLEVALRKLGLPFIRVSIGDQHVMEELQKRSWQLGGENSGHIVYLPVNTTSDGIISALLVLEALINSGKTLNELKKGMTKWPQRIVNIPCHDRHLALDHPILEKQIKSAEKELKTGRIVLRYSGTEQVIRLMVEAQDSKQLDEIISQLTDTITQLTKI